MKRAVPLLVLLVLLFTACSTHEPPARAPDSGPYLTSITIGTSSRAGTGFTPLGIPFISGSPAVQTLAVEIYAGADQLAFDADDDTYTYNPAGGTSTLHFGMSESVIVTLPAGATYTFKTSGTDVHDTWIAYGETDETVGVATVSVNLVLHTLIDMVSITTSAPLNFVVPGQTLDFYLDVRAPGGHPVPYDDYTTTYNISAGDGTSIGESDAGLRATATPTPADDFFTLGVAVTGWANDGGMPVRRTLTASFEKPFSVSAGFSLDSDAPVVDLYHPGVLRVGSAGTLWGIASDPVGLSRVQVYEGPVLIGSSDSSEYAAAGVARVTFDGSAWSMQWTPAVEGTYGLRAVAIDNSGNQSEDSESVSALESTVIDVVFTSGAYASLTVRAGSTLRLTGQATQIPDTDRFDIHFDGSPTGGSYVTHGNPVAAAAAGVPVTTFAAGTWSVEWVPTVPGLYRLHAWDITGYSVSVTITVQ